VSIEEATSTDAHPSFEERPNQKDFRVFRHEHHVRFITFLRIRCNHCYDPVAVMQNLGAVSFDTFSECQGQCSIDFDCKRGLNCFEREALEILPGCSGCDSYCYKPPKGAPTAALNMLDREECTLPPGSLDIPIAALADYFPSPDT
jgi:hypothetical protein